jgi:DNA-binding XRE family transcriptional regulator
MKNEKIRQYAKRRNVKLWEVAKAVGVSDTTFSKKMREEFPEEKAQAIIELIDELVMKKEEGRA